MKRTRKVELAAVVVTAVLALAAWGTVVVGSPSPVPAPDAEGAALFLVPHPDDEAYGMALTIARQVQAGNRVVVALFTDGESSSRAADWAGGELGVDLDGDGDRDQWDFGLARREEFERSMQALGVRDVVYLGRSGSQGATGHADGSLDYGRLLPEVIRLADEHQAAALFTTMKHLPFDPVKGDARDHPDHGAMSDAVKDAAFELVVPSYHLKVYVYTWPKALRLAPVRIQGDPAALAARVSAIAAYDGIGRDSTPQLWEAAVADPLEYMVPGDSF